MPTTTEDRDEILQLCYRYNHAIDSGDAHGWADTFVEDAEFHVSGRVMAGRDARVAFASAVVDRRHTIANPVIDVTGDTATLRAYVVVFHGKDLSMLGTYEDELVRTPAGWRFAQRTFNADPGF